MTKRAHIRTILVLILAVVLLNVQATSSMVDESTIPISSYNEMKSAQLPDKNIISIDTLKLGSDYVNIDYWSLTTFDNYLYMVSSYMTGTKGKMIIVDISDPTNLIEAGRFESVDSCRQVSVIDNRAYVADDDNGLWIFDVSDPANLSVLGQYSILGLHGVYINHQIAYLATYYDGLRIVNVSDPTNPFEIGSYGTTTRTYRVHIQDDCAYIANADGLEIVNVSVPSSPSFISSVNSSGFKSHMYLEDDFVFITFPYSRMRLYNVSDLTNPVELEEYYMSSGIAEIQIVGSLVFTTSNFLGLQIFNLHNYDTYSAVGRFKPDGESRAVLHKEGYFYLVDHHSGLWCLEHDCDEDELYSRREYEAGTSSDNPDSDFDSIPDGWEVQYGMNPLVNDSLLDVDDDSLSASDEYQFGTNPLTNDTDIDTLSDSAELFIHGTSPTNSDSDFDQLPDGWEIANSLDPLVHDSANDEDADGLTNLGEYTEGTDPNDNDSDNDLLPDGWEVQYSLNPLANDSYLDPDMDNLDNLFEYKIGTNPHLADSDQDGYLDSWEFYNGFNPLDPNVAPAQFFVYNLGWIGLVSVTMGIVATLWVIKKYKSSDTYEGYPYDGTSSRR